MVVTGGLTAIWAFAVMATSAIRSSRQAKVRVEPARPRRSFRSATVVGLENLIFVPSRPELEPLGLFNLDKAFIHSRTEKPPYGTRKLIAGDSRNLRSRSRTGIRETRRRKVKLIHSFKPRQLEGDWSQIKLAN